MKTWTGYVVCVLLCICMVGCGKEETGSKLLNETKDAVEPAKEMVPMMEETKEGSALHLYCGDDYADQIIQKIIYVQEVDEQVLLEHLTALLGMDETVGMNSLSFGTYGGDKVALLDMNQAFEDYLNHLGTSGEYIVMGSLVNTFLDCYQCDLMIVTADGKVLETGHTIYEEYLEMYPYVEASYRVTEMLLEEETMRISCPQIKDLGDDEIQGKWNRIFLGTEERAMDEWGGNGTYEVNYTVKTMNEDMLSILMDGYVHEEGEAHPYTFKYTYNIDLHTGESIRLADHVDVKKAAENLFAGIGYYVEESLAPYFAERLQTIYENPDTLAKSLEGYDYTESGTAPYGYSYLADGKVWLCMEVPHALGDYIEIELETQ